MGGKTYKWCFYESGGEGGKIFLRGGGRGGGGGGGGRRRARESAKKLNRLGVNDLHHDALRTN